MHLADAFIQSDLQLQSGYTFSLVCMFPGNRTHNLLRCWRNALPLSHTGTLWLLAPSNPLWPICPLWSVVDQLWSVVDHPSPRDSTRLAGPEAPPSGSSIPSAPPQSSVTPAPPRPSGSPPPYRSPKLFAPPWPSGFSLSPWLIGSPSPPRAPPSVGSTMGQHYGCGLGSTWHRLLQAPGSSLRLIRSDSSCFLLGSSLHRLHPGLCSSSSSLPNKYTRYLMYLDPSPCSLCSSDLLPALCYPLRCSLKTVEW